MAKKLQLRTLSDCDLLRRLSELVQQSRRVESELVAHIAEVDARRLYEGQACPSMFAYCTEMLHLSEWEAYHRIAVARATREYPVLLEMLRDGQLHLSGIAKLAPHLTKSNRETVLTRAAHKSKRQIEVLVAELAPRPDVPTVVRKLPERKSTMLPSPAPPAKLDKHLLGPDQVDLQLAPIRQPTKPVEPLAPSRYKVQFTASAGLHEKLQRLRAMTGSTDLAEVIESAVTEKLQRLEAKRYGKTAKPRRNLEDTDTSPSSRYIPAAVKRTVQKRDARRCAFVDQQGRRCNERQRLEFHHRRPFALGGDHSADNIVLMCRTHNGYLAERDYGIEKMASYRHSIVSEPLAVYALSDRAPPSPRLAQRLTGHYLLIAGRDVSLT